MGIPYAFHYYYNKYNCENELIIDLLKLNTINISHLFFDYNSLIHPCAYQILEDNKEKYIKIMNLEDRTTIIENDIIDNCLLYTKSLIDSINCKYVYIVIDGVAPRSKMNQQRERRYKSEFFRLKDEVHLWDSNKITPGTLFMRKLKESLAIFMKSEKTNTKTIILSDSNEKGEGEHKIMSIISNEVAYDTKYLVYGLDADLIMLSLINRNFNNIILIRDNSFSKNNVANKAIDYLDISRLKGYICNDMITLIQSFNLDYDNLLYDYILLCFLLGNDFLEALPSLSIRKKGIDTIMKAYANSWKGDYLINKIKMNSVLDFSDCINLTFLKNIMFQLKNHEIYFFKNFRLDTLKDSTEKIENVYFYQNDLINFQMPEYKNRYYIYNEINKVDEICLNYIEGLYWILGYYNNHIHNNWSWYYRFHATPFCSDIFEYLNSFENKKNGLIKNYINNSINLKKSIEFSPIKQLFMVLPRKSLYSILSNVNYPNIEILNNTLLSDEKYYPKELYVDIFNKRYLWQSKILFNKIDENILDLFI